MSDLAKPSDVEAEEVNDSGVDVELAGALSVVA